MPLYVPLDQATFTRLRRLAQQERRRPQDQAAILIERALAHVGAYQPDADDESDPSQEEDDRV